MTIPKKLSTVFSFILVGLLFVAFFASHAPKTEQAQIPVSFNRPLMIGDTELQVALASLPPEQRQGLSGTKTLPDDEGMLFLFPTETKPSFWMKDMNYSLDIIWIGADKKVAEIMPNLAPSTYPKSFTPKKPAQYVLEVPAGFAEKNNIMIGTAMSF